MTHRLLALSLAVCLPAVCDSSAGLNWTPAANWKAQPQRPMRAATYTVPAAGDKEDGECAVFYFGPGQGGDVEANIQRWLGQFQEKPASPPKPKRQKIAGLDVTIIEHSGTYLSGGMMSAARASKPGYKLIGAIVEGPQGNIFFKLTGPVKTVDASAAAFQKMLQSLRKQ